MKTKEKYGNDRNINFISHERNILMFGKAHGVISMICTIYFKTDNRR